MENDYRINHITEQTGLSEKYIRRVLKEIPEIVDHHARHGERNALFFDTNGLHLFQQIANYNAEKLTLRQIRQRVLPSFEKTEAKREPNSEETPHLQKLLSLIETNFSQSREDAAKLLESKDALLSEKDSRILQLQEQMRFLTDGRTLEEMRAAETDRKRREEEERRELERQADEERQARALAQQELEAVRQKLAEAEANRISIEEVQATAKRQQEILEKAERERQATRAKLLAELAELEGKFFKGGRRKEILAALRDLELPLENLRENQTVAQT